MIQLDEEAKRNAINLAMTIECGVFPMENVLKLLREAPDVMKSIMYFWNDFNDMTKNVVRMVLHERCKTHVQNCYEKEAVPHPIFDVKGG